MFDQILVQFAALTGIAALLALIINVLKFFKVIKDGEAPLYSAGANLIVILTMYGFKLFRPDFDFGTLDPIAAEIATVGTFVLSYVTQLLTAKVAHFALKGLPVVGKSYSEEAKLYLG